MVKPLLQMTPLDNPQSHSKITQQKREGGTRPRMRRNPVSSETSAQCSLMSTDLGWDGHFELHYQIGHTPPSPPCRAPGATRTNNFPLRRGISEILTLGGVGGGGGSPPSILIAGQAHIFHFHQKVIIRRDVIQNATSSWGSTVFYFWWMCTLLFL